MHRLLETIANFADKYLLYKTEGKNVPRILAGHLCVCILYELYHQSVAAEVPGV